MGKWRGKPDKSVKTTCVICPVACDMNVNTKHGKLVQIGSVPGKRTNPPQLCLRGKFLPAEISDHPERITTPLIKRDNKWIEVPWEKAIETITGKLEKHRGSRFGIIASGQDTLEDNYILQKFARNVMRSNNVDLHHSYPNREIPELIHRMRMLQATAGLAEVEQADTLLLFGTDASLSHPMLENRIRKAYATGKQVISFGALPTRTSTFTTNELLYSPGGEEGLLLLLLSALDEKQNLQNIIQSAEDQSGIQASQLEPVIALLAESHCIRS
jgi:predicted molibdopterin-dependent oxidoreductase YjgC